MIALAAFRVAAYVRSHRVYQALVPILAMLAIVYASRAPRGVEMAALTDSAVLIVPFLAWSARGVLDTEPDEQRVISATSVGGALRENAAGLLAALVTGTAFAALSLVAGFFLGLSSTPPASVTVAAVVLHVLSVVTGVTLGALTSRAILPSPAMSIMGLLLGFLFMLVVSMTPVYWLTVPLTAWMRAASAGDLPDRLPLLGGVALGWCLVGLAIYVA
ncbi:MAG: hypothetical protein HOY71_03545, partial [Nonomuraea sp.]|nr:hypothetical protein [Nonomuraea sp.]